MNFLYKRPCLCFNKSVLNWTFCQLLHWKFEPLDCPSVHSGPSEEKSIFTQLFINLRANLIITVCKLCWLRDSCSNKCHLLLVRSSVGLTKCRIEKCQGRPNVMWTLQKILGQTNVAPKYGVEQVSSWTNVFQPLYCLRAKEQYH